MEETKRVNLIVYGQVQGVGYRAYIARTAKELNLCGWIRNLKDGTVEIEAQGAQKMLEELIFRAKKGPQNASVTSIRKDEKTPDSNLDRFSVIMDVI